MLELVEFPGKLMQKGATSLLLSHEKISWWNKFKWNRYVMSK